MKKYFRDRVDELTVRDVSREQIERYRYELLEALRSMGATDSECRLVHDATVINSICNQRKPEDVAWAILQ